MSTSIRVSDETKAKLSRLKRENETWDEFLTRVTRDGEPIEFGSWSAEETEEAMDRLREGRERPE